MQTDHNNNTTNLHTNATSAISVVPTSFGGMLAEEWTIQPLSAMPSFLERMFMLQTQQSTYQSLDFVYDFILQQLQKAQQLLAVSQSPHRRLVETAAAQAQRSSTTTALLQWTQKLRSTILAICQQSIHRTIGFMRRYKLALLCLCVYIIERTSLERNACLLSESFYGGRRVKLVPAQKGRRTTLPLKAKDKIRLAGIVALSFFLEKKSRQVYLHWKTRQSQAPQLLSHKQQLFVMVYPWIQSLLQGSSLLCQWHYLLGDSVFFDVPSLLLQHWVRRLTLDDYDKKTTSSSSSSPPSSTPQASPKSADANNHAQHLSVAALLGLGVSWVTWCRSIWPQILRQQQQQRYGDNKGGIPPPPPCPPAISPIRRDGSCCLCGRNPPVQPTACTVSGYIGCAVCMKDYLQRNLRCPVTHYPCKADGASMVRLKEPG